jgi:hypothetical protein
MARSALDKAEAEGDFALGMGIAIGMFIALFAVAIALFVIEQGKSRTPPGRDAVRDASAVLLPVESPAGSATTRTTP